MIRNFVSESTRGDCNGHYKKKSFKGQKADLTVVMVTQSLLATVGFGGFSVTPCGRGFAGLGPYNTFFKCFASDGDYIS